MTSPYIPIHTNTAGNKEGRTCPFYPLHTHLYTILPVNLGSNLGSNLTHPKSHSKLSKIQQSHTKTLCFTLKSHRIEHKSPNKEGKPLSITTVYRQLFNDLTQKSGLGVGVKGLLRPLTKFFIYFLNRKTPLTKFFIFIMNPLFGKHSIFEHFLFKMTIVSRIIKPLIIGKTVSHFSGVNTFLFIARFWRKISWIYN